MVDFWTYPPDREPPSFDEIINANPNLFSPNGKLSQVLTALEGNVTYVRGNHDMTIIKEDLGKIKNPQGYKIKLSEDIYYLLVIAKKLFVLTGIYTPYSMPHIPVQAA